MCQSISVLIEFVTKICPTCGVHYALDESFDKRKNNTGEGWYCPNGHSLIYTKSKLKELQEEVDDRDKRINGLHNQLTNKNLQIDGLQKEIVRKEKRAKAGVCPCCNRTFKSLVNHMKTKHPEFTKPVDEIHKKISAKK